LTCTGNPVTSSPRKLGVRNEEHHDRHAANNPIQQSDGIFLWLVASGVLAKNIFLFLQNRGLNEALAPQITMDANNL